MMSVDAQAEHEIGKPSAYACTGSDYVTEHLEFTSDHSVGHHESLQEDLKPLLAMVGEAQLVLDRTMSEAQACESMATEIRQKRHQISHDHGSNSTHMEVMEPSDDEMTSMRCRSLR
jgi:hypothetical protein